MDGEEEREGEKIPPAGAVVCLFLVDGAGRFSSSVGSIAGTSVAGILSSYLEIYQINTNISRTYIKKQN